MNALCRHLGISPQAYYQQRRRELRRAAESATILLIVRMVRRRHPRMGTRKLLAYIRPMLAQEGLTIGRDRLLTLLRDHDLLVPRLRRRRRTTWGGSPCAPNRLIGTPISYPDAAWVADITYLDMASGGFRYLFLLMDLYSRYIVGWHVASSLGAEQALVTLRMAIQQAAHPLQGLIHHSDHGVQYTSTAYLHCLATYGILPSMGEVGNAYDNAYAERVLGTLKHEYALNAAFRSHQEVQRAVAEAIHLYNTDRPHASLAYATPLAVYRGDVSAEVVWVPGPQEDSR